MSPPLKEVVSASTKGQGGKSGLVVRAGFTVASKALSLVIEVENHSGQAVKDFDLMFNKNPFAIAISGVAGTLEFPPSQTEKKTLKCSIDKKNLDAKNPPASPFKVQVAMKTSLDIYYFEVPCALHCLLDLANPLKPEEFKKFWEMIAKTNESTYSVGSLYGGYTSSKFN